MDRASRVKGLEKAGSRSSVAVSGAVLSTASFLSKKTKGNIWRKRWYELNESKLAWYNSAAKKVEIGNLPLFLVTNVEEGPKPTQFRVMVKDESRPEILLQAANTEQRDEWVKLFKLSLEQRKVKALEEHDKPAAAATPVSYDNDDKIEEAEPVRAPVVATSSVGVMTKEAHEKFAKELRQLVLDQDVAGVRAMLDPSPPADALLYFFKDELERHFLHFAVDLGDLKIAGLLAEQDKRLLDITDHLGFTPLHIAALKGVVEMGELLLRLGANPLASDNNGRLPFYIALASGHHAFAKFLLKRNAAGPGWLPIHVAAIGGVRAHIEKEVEAGEEILSVHPGTNLNALHLAASSDDVGSAEAVLYLLEKGPSLHDVDYMRKTALHFAASAGALQPLRVLLAKGANAAALDKMKRTPLHMAAGSCHAEVAELLIDKGAPHSSEDESGWTPLHLACFQGSVTTVRALIARHARVDARGPRALTPLMMCCSDEVAPVAALLLQADADANAINREGRSAIFDAVVNKSMSVCTLLLKHDANVNKLDDSSVAPLHLALDWPEGFTLLLENGADPNIPLDNGSTVLFEVCSRGHTDLVKLLRDKKVDLNSATSESDHLFQTGLHAAAAGGHLPVVQFLIAEKVNLDALDKDGRTALHLAASHGSSSVVQALLEAGAAPSERDHVTGNTPLHVACEKGHESCVSLLKKAQKNVHLENLAQKTALHLAAESKSYACVSLLLEGCPDNVVVAKDSTGRTALHYALRGGEVDSAMSLVWAGCSPGAADNDATRPFHLAARLGKRKLLLEMIQKETCDPSWVDSSQRNALHYAAAGGSAEVLQIIIELCGERLPELINSVDCHGTTCIHFACEFNFADCAKALLAAGASLKVKNEAGLYPIHTAAKKGKESLEVLLQAGSGPDVNICDDEGLTPLLIACLHGNVAGARALLDAGANMSTRDIEGLGAAHAAIEAGDALLLKVLAERGADLVGADNSGSSPLHLAASSGNAECVSFLLSQSTVNPNALDGEKRTALLLAAAAGHIRVVELLALDERVDISLKNAEGQNALLVSTQNGKFDVAKVLLKRKDVDIKAVDGAGRTVLHNVVLHDNVELTRLFLNYIAPNALTSQLVTPLHEACVRGSLRSAKILLDAGADVNARALQGLTPCHNAASFAQNDVIELLVSHNPPADVNAKSERGLTPLMCAAAMGHSRTIILLFKLGADVDAVDVTRESALHKAANAGSISCVTVLIERGAEVNLANEKNETAYDKARKKGHARVCETLRDNS